MLLCATATKHLIDPKEKWILMPQDKCSVPFKLLHSDIYPSLSSPRGTLALPSPLENAIPINLLLYPSNYYTQVVYPSLSSFQGTLALPSPQDTSHSYKPPNPNLYSTPPPLSYQLAETWQACATYIDPCGLKRRNQARSRSKPQHWLATSPRNQSILLIVACEHISPITKPTILTQQEKRKYMCKWCWASLNLVHVWVVITVQPW